MTITVRMTLTRAEVEQYRKEWKETNDGEITDEEIMDEYVDWFYADLHDYVDNADVEVEIV